MGEAISEGHLLGSPCWGRPSGTGAEVSLSPQDLLLPSQDGDFEPLWPSAPIFQLVSGEDKLYEGESTVCPVFINEAAH